MSKILKSPLFFVKLADAFVMRLPISFLTVAVVMYLLLGEAGADAVIENGTLMPYMLLFSFVYAFLYVVIGKKRTASQMTLVRFGEAIYTIGALGIALTASQNLNIGLIEYFETYIFKIPFLAVCYLWIVYMVPSELVKGKLYKKSVKRIPASEDPGYKSFCELACVDAALMKFNSIRDQKQFDELMRSSDALLKSIDNRKKANIQPGKNKRKNPSSRQQAKNAAGAATPSKTGNPFFDSDAMKGYKKYVLNNHVVICLAGDSAFVVKLVEKNGDYRQAPDCWYRNDKRTSNYTAELEGTLRILKSKCALSQVSGVIVKTFQDGSIECDNSYEVIDASSSYSILEKKIKTFMPLDEADRHQTSVCAKNISKEFKKRFAVERKGS